MASNAHSKPSELGYSSSAPIFCLSRLPEECSACPVPIRPTVVRTLDASECDTGEIDGSHQTLSGAIISVPQAWNSGTLHVTFVKGMYIIIAPELVYSALYISMGLLK